MKGNAKMQSKIKCSMILLSMGFIISSLSFGQDMNIPKREKKYMNINSNLDGLIEIYNTNKAQALNFSKSHSIIQRDNNVMIYIIPEDNDSKKINVSLFEQYGISYRKSRKSVTAEVPIKYLEKIVTELKGVHYIDIVRPPIPQGFISQGRTLMNATNFNNLGYKGTNVKVAVLDSSFKNYSSAVTSGELPISTVAKNFTSEQIGTETSAHGTGCAEIIHDLAPEAQIYLIKTFSLTDSENAIDYCIENEISIISHSMGWPSVNFFDGTGTYVEWVKDAVNNGILFINSAGNYAHSNWMGSTVDANDNKWIEFSTSGYEVLEIDNPGVNNEFEISLIWNNFPLTNEDYDLYLYDKNLNLITESITKQNNDEPLEVIKYTPKPGDTNTYYIAVRKYNVSQDYKIRVLIHGTDITDAIDQVPAGSITTPADASEALAVGAIYQANYTDGPIEHFSSQGPTHDGRIKPDISAPDGVNTYAYSPASFYGTSASAPHVAGIACILKGMMPEATVSQLREYIESSAIDMGNKGKDNIYGYGRLLIPESIIDATPPKSSITVFPPSPLKTGQFNITLTIDDDSYIVGIPTVTYSLSDGTVKTVDMVGSNKSWSGSSCVESYTTEGQCTFNYSATDLQNNIGAEITSGKTFEIDTTIHGQYGGSISNSDGTKINLPPNSFTGDINIIISETNTSYLKIALANNNLGESKTLQLVDIYRDFFSTGHTNFTQDIVVTIPYMDVDNDGIVDNTNINEERLTVACLNESTNRWDYIADSNVDKESNFVSASVNRLSIFALLDDLKIKKDIGGVVVSPDGTKIVIPPGILSDDAYISIFSPTSSELLISEANLSLRDYRTIALPDIYREFILKSVSGGNIIANGSFRIYIPYTDIDNDGMLDGSNTRVDGLKMAYLNETTKRWELISNSSVLKNYKLVMGQINHLSYFTLLPVMNYSDLNKVYLYPNPLRLGISKTVKIVNLPNADLNVDIYNVAGELVRTLTSTQGIDDFLGGKIGIWDAKNGDGEYVSSGVYIIVIQTANETKVEKVAIIK